MTSWPPDFRAEGRIARLEPLSPDHRAGLAEAAADGDLQALWYTSVPAPEAMPDEIGRRLALRARGSMLPLTVFEALTGRVAGMTTYMNIDAANRRVEIGSTWTRASAQRTGLNTEAKRLLLGHAFEALDCIAVEFRTHVMNRQSRAAIERLGAKLDGILRAHMVLPNGTLRDTAVYSVTAADWPAVKASLHFLLRRSGAGDSDRIERGVADGLHHPSHGLRVRSGRRSGRARHHRLARARLGHTQIAAQILQLVAELVERRGHLVASGGQGVHPGPLADEQVFPLAGADEVQRLHALVAAQITVAVEVDVVGLVAGLDLHADDVERGHAPLLIGYVRLT